MDADDQGQAIGQPAPPVKTPIKKVKKQYPQKSVDDFWDNFTTKFPGKVNSILPQNIYAKAKAAHEPKGKVHGQAAIRSYEQAKAGCVAAVEKIAKECRRVNMKYRDPHFDIEFDLKGARGVRDCLEGLVPMECFEPCSVKRVPDIFNEPQFYIDDATPADVRQGNDGDCWFMSALCALGNKPGLIDRICVARDEKVGVYGFVFHRDGEWIQTIIDDKLYLTKGDYDESFWEKYNWNQLSNRQDAEEEYRVANQTGSKALYFAQCSHQNETWLPLLEKAYAKAHGDFEAISGGFTGEAIEDLTGGVTTELFTTDILDKDKFWTEEIMKVNQDFLFGCATGVFNNWQGYNEPEKKGIYTMHAYSVLEAREVKGERLLRIRNPWGKSEWQGPWSDGSEQWTGEWMDLLGHRFGNDGMFWISYKDLLRKYQCFDRTRLFGPEWSVTQQWTTLNVPWSADYNDTKFSITLDKQGPIVIVLSQLDDRYYKGLEGQYVFELHFRLGKEGEHDYIVRSHGNYMMNRSVSTDLELDPGTYSVLMKVTAVRYPSKPTPEELVKQNCRARQDKLLQMGLAYDLAHAKGQTTETEQEKKIRTEREERKKVAARKKQREELRAKWYKQWLIGKKQKERVIRHKQKAEEHRRKKAEARKVAGLPDGNTKGDQTLVVNGTHAESKTEEPASGGAAEPKPTEPDATALSTASQAAESTAAALTESAEKPSGKDETTQAKIDKFNRELDSIPAVQINGDPSRPSEALEPRVSAADIPPSPAPNANANANATADMSDISSIPSFDSSIDTLLDLEPLDISPGTENRRAPQDPTIPDTAAPEDKDSENEEVANDPWNAVCVVGLRVYTKDKGVTVSVVRPKNIDEEEETPLDLDDPNKGVSGEVEVGGEGVEGVKQGIKS